MIIENFKGSESFDVPEFRQFNFIIGDNNYGKTSLLEAICLLDKVDRTSNIARIAADRMRMRRFSNGTSIYTSLLSLFNKKKMNLCVKYELTDLSLAYQIHANVEEVAMNADILKRSRYMENDELTYLKFVHEFLGEIEVSINDTIKSTQVLSVYETDGWISNNQRVTELVSVGNQVRVTYISNFDRIMNNSVMHIIKDRNLKQKVLIMLNHVFENEFIDLRLIEDGYGGIYESLSTEDTELPLSSYGEGIRQAILLFEGIVKAENGILLIDEIEGGLHRKAVDSLIPMLLKFAKEYHVQIIATTHSEEVVDSVLGTYQEETNPLLDDIDIVRIIKNKNKEKQCIIRKGEEALKLRQDAGMDLG